jgi:outer membrane lipase/esterase
MRISSASNVVRRGCRALCACLALLAACGGGTSQIEPFEPRQIILLGDESAVLTADGKSYSINALTATNTINCSGLPIWTQLLVTSFGMVVDRCNPNTVTARGITRGAPGAKAAHIEAQISAQFNAESPTTKDLFLIMVGLNDIIERFEAGANCGDPELRARGTRVAEQVNRLAAAGARTIVVTVHDLGLTPYARSRNESTRLTCLTADFNARVRVDILQDGRFIGLVLADDLSLSMSRNPASYALNNITDAACAVALPDCTTSTLVSGATTGTHMWADDRRLGPVAHNYIMSFAEARARNNPF